MDALLFYSGGIDSTVLATNIAKHPHEFGITAGGSLALVKMVKPGGSSQVKGFRDWLRAQDTAMDVYFQTATCNLLDAQPDDVPEGGHQTQYPLLSGYAPDRDSAPYTPALHLWLAGYGANLLARQPLPAYGPRKAFWGFQEDGPYWTAKDAGKVPPNDASEDWVKALNALMDQAPTKVRFYAPFLERRMDRSHIVDLGESLGVPWELTSSCMYGWNPQGCGVCHQCVRWARVFASKGIKL